MFRFHRWILIAAFAATAPPRAILAEDPQEEGAAAGGSEKPLGTILEKWKTRQNGVRTAKYAATNTVTTAKGRFSWFGADGEVQRAPLDDAVYYIEESVLLDGGWVKHAVQGPVWYAGEKEFIHTKRIYTNLNNINKTFNNPVGAGGARLDALHPQGFINDGVGNLGASASELKMFFLFCRPMDETLGGPLGGGAWTEFKITGKARVEDHDCYVLERARGGAAEQYWVDPRMEYVVRKIVYRVGAADVFTLEASYAESSFGWVPSAAATATRDEKGGSLESSITDVEAFEINVKVKPNELEVDFPPGTFVVDQRKSAKLKAYLVGSDGTKSPAAGGESYTDLLRRSEMERPAALEKSRADPPPRSEPARSGRTAPTAVVSGLLGAFAAAILVFQKKGRRPLDR